MNDNFLEAIKTYLKIVEDACTCLIEYIEQEEESIIRNKYDLYDYLHRSHKFEFVIGKRKYIIHGIGCSVYEGNVAIIEWDFGCKSWWCGIEPYKMSYTLKCCGYKEADYHDLNFVKAKCEGYVLREMMYYYKGQYYINLLSFGRKKMEFPTDYDSVVIEYKGMKKTFPRSKRFDKFVRKSNFVYSGIGDLKDNYILVFYNLGKEVARIPYNDKAYQDSAVKIMSEEIMKPHIVE